MSAYTQNIFINIHSDFEHPFDVIDSDGNIVDVTNLDLASQMRKHADSRTAVGFGVTVLNAELGKIQISMGSTLTGTLKPGRHVYDIISIARDSGLKSMIVEGTVLARAGISSGCF